MREDAKAFGVDYHDNIPDGWTALEFVAIIKCLNKDGVLSLVFTSSAGVSSWEAVGMYRSAEATELNDLVKTIERDDDDE